ncbi:MAG: ATP-binding cassette domain-containing protein [Herbinix sp.]|jgi:cell division transport system ATP-binding protein|nr:ATP-binding cassette domain-containing protein [Herbinix sp.]
MIILDKVSLIYTDKTQALIDINVNIKPGEIVYITGPSGSGKTSLLKLIMGMEYPTSGTLSVLGRQVKNNSSGNIRKIRRCIGPVFQEFKLIEGRTTLENVMMGMRFLGVKPRIMKAAANEALEKVGLGHKKLSMVENLSWGESQRVAIARAVARKPSLILADEPTGNLDYDNAINILGLLKSFKDENTTVIITTHATHLIEDEQNATFISVDKGRITIERRYQ